ncbi:ScbR family autoregulator-binding transcription factor [Streptomyces sp. NPDC054904]|uniref:ScbR family autoregulator-binding transcription factor n=1 Tax=unclassified Streptomyces TaxID=2593676 RepID=UPI002481C365|nr:ScbR family autoregulator-binding transcription factor [Streptomyces sp. Isolate_45]MDA5283743.1 ScbR family autoregulator-binding transcription factor [Streptomyces sp. Isolate_45]
MVKQERAARTREVLVRAAAEVFAEEGFVTASIAAISKRAGVSAGGLHFHFGSKTALAEAVARRASATLRTITVSRVPDGNALQALVDSTHELMELLARDPVVNAGFGLCAGTGAVTLTARGGGAGWDLRVQWQRWVEGTFRAAQREGRLADGVSPQAAAAAVVAAMVGFGVLGAGAGAGGSRQFGPSGVTPYWQLMLPRLAARGSLGELVPDGSDAVRASLPY